VLRADTFASQSGIAGVHHCSSKIAEWSGSSEKKEVFRVEREKHSSGEWELLRENREDL